MLSPQSFVFLEVKKTIPSYIRSRQFHISNNFLLLCTHLLSTSCSGTIMLLVLETNVKKNGRRYAVVKGTVCVKEIVLCMVTV